MSHFHQFAAAGYAAPAQIALADFFACGGTRRAEQDCRWPLILRRLARLRKRNRRALRIVDASCGAGDLLIAAANRARALGFLAIEACGVDTDPARIACARRASGKIADPAIGFEFAIGDASSALRREVEAPADIVLYATEAEGNVALVRLARHAGEIALCDQSRGNRAAA